MPFKLQCCCSKHSEWGYGAVAPKDLYALTYLEAKFCGSGQWSTSGHKERKRKICKFCGDRLALERKCEMLGVSNMGRRTRQYCIFIFMVSRTLYLINFTFHVVNWTFYEVYWNFCMINY